MFKLDVKDSLHIVEELSNKIPKVEIFKNLTVEKNLKFSQEVIHE